MHFDGQINLLSHDVKLPAINLKESTAQFDHFAQQVIDKVVSHLWDLAKTWLGDAATYINFVKNAAIKDVKNIVAALHKVYHKDIEEIGVYVKEVKGVLQLGANDIARLMKAEFAGVADIEKRVAAALFTAEFDAAQVGSALYNELHVHAEGIARALKKLKRPLGEIAVALRHCGDPAWNNAKKIAEFFKNEWHESGNDVKRALEAAKFPANEIKHALKDVYDWFKKAAHKVKHWFKKHY